MTPKYKRKEVAKKVEFELFKPFIENIEQIKSRGRRASSLSYYDELVTSTKRLDELTSSDTKVIGTLCNFVPQELIYGANAFPLRLCSGIYHTVKVGEELLPRDICPVIKSTLGAKLLGVPYFEVCELVIVPTSCDGKKKLGELLSSYTTVWILELPQTKGYSEMEGWVKELTELKENIEHFTGVKVTKEKLISATSLLKERHEVFLRLYKIREEKPGVISGGDFFLVIFTSFYDDVKRWIKNTKELCDELENMAPLTHNKGINLLLTGAPIIWPNLKLIHIIEEMGANVVADDMCSGTQYLYDPVIIDEQTQPAILQAIAQRYLLPSTCPCFTTTDDRIDRLLERIEYFSVDGIVYHNLRLCQLFDIEQSIIQQVLQSKNIPMLTIYTDYSKEDVGQIKTRVETFIEMLSH